MPGLRQKAEAFQLTRALRHRRLREAGFPGQSLQARVATYTIGTELIMPRDGRDHLPVTGAQGPVTDGLLRYGR